MILVTKVVPYRGQALTVTTPKADQNTLSRKKNHEPCGIEFDKDILGVIENDLFKVLSDEDVHGLVLLSRNRLALELRLDFAIKILMNPFADTFSGNFLALVIRILELFLKILDDECGPFGFTEVESLCVITKLNSINPNEIDLRLVLGSNGLNGGNVGILVLERRVDEEVCKRLGTIRVDAVVFTVDLVNYGNRKVRNPILEVFLCEGCNRDGVLSLRFVEGTINDNSGRSNTSSFNNILVSCQTKQIVITFAFSSSVENRGRRFGGRVEVSNGDNFVGFLEFVMVGGGDIRDGWQ